jgi:hypothetical protein
MCVKCYDAQRLLATTICTPEKPRNRPREEAAWLVLTPEHETELQQAVRQSGQGKSGVSRSAPDHARALLEIHAKQRVAAQVSAELVAEAAAKGVVLQPRQLSFDAAAKATAVTQQISTRNLRAVQKRVADHGAAGLTPVKKERMSLNDPQHARYAQNGPPLAMQCAMLLHLKLAAQKNLYLSTRTMRDAVFAECGEKIPISTLYSWIRGLGYRYRLKKLSGLTPAFSKGLIRRYAIKYATALREQEEGKCIIVYMDETYIHQGYCSSYAWCDRTGTVPL